MMGQWDTQKLVQVSTAKMIVIIWETDAHDIEMRRTVTMFESQAAVSFIRTAVVLGLTHLSFKQIMYVTVLGSIQMNTNEMREFKTLVDLKPFGQPQQRPRDDYADSVFNLLVGLIRETELVTNDAERATRPSTEKQGFGFWCGKNKGAEVLVFSSGKTDPDPELTVTVEVAETASEHNNRLRMAYLPKTASFHIHTNSKGPSAPAAQ